MFPITSAVAIDRPSDRFSFGRDVVLARGYDRHDRRSFDSNDWNASRPSFGHDSVSGIRGCHNLASENYGAEAG